MIYASQAKAPIYKLSHSKTPETQKLAVTDVQEKQWTFFMTPHVSIDPVYMAEVIRIFSLQAMCSKKLYLTASVVFEQNTI